MLFFFNYCVSWIDHENFHPEKLRLDQRQQERRQRRLRSGSSRPRQQDAGETPLPRGRSTRFPSTTPAAVARVDGTRMESTTVFSASQEVSRFATPADPRSSKVHGRSQGAETAASGQRNHGPFPRSRRGETLCDPGRLVCVLKVALGGPKNHLY